MDTLNRWIGSLAPLGAIIGFVVQMVSISPQTKISAFVPIMAAICVTVAYCFRSALKMGSLTGQKWNYALALLWFLNTLVQLAGLLWGETSIRIFKSL